MAVVMVEAKRSIAAWRVGVASFFQVLLRRHPPRELSHSWCLTTGSRFRPKVQNQK